MKQTLTPGPNNSWLPADDAALKFRRRFKAGQMAHGDFAMMRDPVKHRKYFGLLNVGFDNWEPGEIDSKFGTPEKNFERFRKDVAILCGHYDIVTRLDGTARPEAHSIAFANMEDDTFNELYSKTIDLFLKRIYGNTDMTAEELDAIVMEYIGFS